MNLNRIVGYQLVQAGIVTGGNFMREVGKPHKLRPVEFTILQLIRETPHISPTTLAKTLAMTTPSMTVWIDKLAKRKLLVRERSTKDGRGQKLVLTLDGTTLVDTALQALLASEASLLGHLSRGEREILLEILKKISLASAGYPPAFKPPPTPYSDS
jgi:DNA-binding MarR family transcriptional regulator